MSAWCVAFLGATFLLLVVAESPPLVRTKRLTSFSKPVETETKKLHQACSYDSECIYGAECIVNSTIKAGEKRCYCKFGYEEEDNECNSGHIISAIATLVLFTTLALLTTRPN